jgi:hypothetical protein
MNLLLTIGIIVFVLFILNVIFLAVIYFMRKKMAEVSQWPSVMGVVQMSTVERRSSEDGYTDYPVVQYSYQVNGQPYQNSKLAPGPEVGGSGARKVVAKYPAGAQVMVFYNPQNPSDAVLERKAPALWVMWLLLIIFDCSLCGAIPIIWWSMR